MNKYLNTKFKLLLLLPILLVGFVVPVSSLVNAETGTETTTEKTEAEIEAYKQELLKKKEAARQEELKKKLAEKEKAAQQAAVLSKRTKIISGCKPAQAKINGLDKKMNGIQKGRVYVYNNAHTKLTELSQKLSDKDLDTTELDTAITQFKEKTDVVVSLIAAYQQEISDTYKLECQSNPDGFMTQLTELRTKRQEIITASQEAKTVIKDQIKPELLELKQQLEGEEVKETEEPETSEGAN